MINKAIIVISVSVSFKYYTLSMIVIVVVSKIESYEGIEEEPGAAGLWVSLKVQSIEPKHQLP